MRGGSGGAPPAPGVLAAPKHYAWNAETAARQAELERHGGALSPTLVASGGGAEAAASPKPALGSAWNTAGTWEERDVSGTALAALAARLREATYPPSAAGRAVHVVECQVTGKATLISSRGKIRLGYEAELAGKWEVREAGGGGSSGAALAHGALSASLESEEDGGFAGALKVTASGGEATAEATALVKQALAPMRRVVKEWEASLKAV